MHVTSDAHQIETPRPAARRTLLALSLGHCSVDLCRGALFALVPFLVVERHYSYGAVGVFALAASLATACVQPLAGAHGDRGEARWLLPVGLVLAALGMAAIGLVTRYPLILAAAVVCAAGAAAYHPEGARWARFASGSRVTANMSVFSVGGGLAMRSVRSWWRRCSRRSACTARRSSRSCRSSLRSSSPSRCDAFATEPRPMRAGLAAMAGASEWRPFACLIALCCVASGVSTGLLVYVPLFFVHARGTTAPRRAT